MPTSEESEERKKKLIKRVTRYAILFLSELIGTALLIFLACSATVLGRPQSLIETALVVGVIIYIIVATLFCISGGHINPAVTAAALIFKIIPLAEGALYVVSQVIGAILGYGLLVVLIPKEIIYGVNATVTSGFCTTVPNPDVSTVQAFFSEYIATSILIFIVCSVWDRRNLPHIQSGPFKLGMAIFVLVAASAALSGASMNPARTFGPAVFTGIWDRQWIYWLGPLSGSVLTAFFYKYVFENRPEPLEETTQQNG